MKSTPISPRITARKSSLALAIAAALSAGGANITIAQESTLEEIVVTAQFREQNLQQTPLAITAMNAETMEARSQTSINQVAAQAPNVSLAPRGAAYGPSMAITIRGVGQTDFNPAYEPGVGMYVDDVYYATLTGSIMDLLDLDRVEISRGPQGTLAGRNSIGGAIKLYSRAPVGDDSGFLAATYGSRHRLDIRGSVDFAMTDSISARLSGVSKQQDGYVKRLDYGCVFPNSGIPRNMSSNTDCVMAREGEINYDAFRGIVRWDASSDFSLTVIGDYTDDDRVTTPSVLTFANYVPSGASAADVDPYGSGLPLSAFVPPDESYYNYAGYVQEETANRPGRVTDGRSFFRGFGWSVKADWAITDTLGFESISAYREYDSGFSNDNDLSPLNQQIGDGTLPFWSVSQEFRLNGTLSEIDWTLGAFFMKQRSTYASYQDLRYSALPAFQQDDPVDAESQAAFAHLNWSLTDDLAVVAGVRFTDESKDYNFVRQSPDGGPVAIVGPLNGVVGSYSGDKWDYRLGVQYQLTDAVMTYAQVATGFKGGGVNPRPFIPGQVQPFGPEELTSYELGLKSELLDRTLRLNAALFFSDYTDIQLTASSCPQYGPAPCALPINGGDADVVGVELEINYQPIDGMIIDASVSTLDFEYTYINPVASDIDPSDVTPFTPDLKWSTGIQYSFFMDNGTSITPRLDISYQDDIFTTGGNSDVSKIDAYTLANARLTWRNELRGWEAALEVTNITEEYYFTSIYDASTRAGLAYGSPGHPREWAATLKKHF